jgi:nicotinamidase/pyrazinamidase
MSRALLIIDFQNDFTSGGALEVPGGDQIAEPVKSLASQFEYVFATRDWHPPDHASFETEGGPWPVHCVQGTHGAELHPAMRDIRVDDPGDGDRALEEMQEAAKLATSRDLAPAARR